MRGKETRPPGTRSHRVEPPRPCTRVVVPVPACLPTSLAGTYWGAGAAFRPLRRKRGATSRIRGSYVHCMRAPRLFSSVRGIRRTRRIISGRARPGSRAQAKAWRRSVHTSSTASKYNPILGSAVTACTPTRPSKLQARESNGAPAFHNKLSASVPNTEQTTCPPLEISVTRDSQIAAFSAASSFPRR